MKLGNEKLKTVARAYDQPRTTLRRYIEKVDKEYDDISIVIDENLEETLKRLCTHAPRQVGKLRQKLYFILMKY